MCNYFLFHLHIFGVNIALICIFDVIILLVWKKCVKMNYIRNKTFSLPSIWSPIKVIPITTCMLNSISEVKNILYAFFSERVGILNFICQKRRKKLSDLQLVSFIHLFNWIEFKTRLFTVFILKLNPSRPYKTKLLLRGIIENS